MIRSGGYIFTEDFFWIDGQGPFTETETQKLQEDVFCKGSELQTREQLVAQLEECGFEDIQFQDKTADWTKFVGTRLAAHNSDESKTRFVGVHGEQTHADLGKFYTTMAELFGAGRLGGVRYWAKRK
jgi:hypothetical protein